MTLISFVVNHVKDSPKRLASFKVFQADGSSALRPLSTTRWVCRYPVVASFVENYEQLMDWFEARIYDGDLTSEDRSKALSTLKSMEKFRTYYMVRILQRLFSFVHPIHTLIQSPEISITEVKGKLRALENLLNTRGKDTEYMTSYYETIKKDALQFKIYPPTVPRSTGRGARNHGCVCLCLSESEVQVYNLDMFTTLFTDAAKSLSNRYKLECMDPLEKLESVVILGESTFINDVAAFYPVDLDADRLTTEQDIFFSYVTSKNLSENVKRLKGIQNLLSEDNTLKDILPNYTMAVRLLLVLPATSCTAERSFSCLRRLKSWLRSNMGEQRLTYLALLNISRELVDNINLKKVVNGFVKGATVRENTFLHLK